MVLFSERYGYTHPSDVIVREQITPEIQNAICSCYDRLLEMIRTPIFILDDSKYQRMERHVWTQFLNQRESKFPVALERDNHISTGYFENSKNPWYRKLDLLEFTIKYLLQTEFRYDSKCMMTNTFIRDLNSEFQRLNFAYRIVNGELVEITSEAEIKAIESALHDSKKNIQIHLNKALELYAQRPVGDYRNSIKESISAVEAYCREQTGESTLGSALKKLESVGIVIPPMLKDAFEKLYVYTNQPDTGIRHALMDDTGTYTPGAEEALFMLVSCSAFINYLSKK